ncbi:carbohydrate porin [Vibrio sp. SS-MA-C1-2]|uniref:carbohydrate porin n=1 Tax=Vibrio sp. SS-MA-C1-2 TaxID=2908646 RepID=UPI001F361D58|nr:carbohydrate porin [Vibrio sp. SS-MA-C1-2]UJF18720.1 carbohydrate porin [Vibrio sp. SS-MA-C1-2]
MKILNKVKYSSYILGATLFSGSLFADQLLPIPKYDGDITDRGYLLGDLGGYRTKLADKGVQIDFSTTSVLQGITDGGVSQGSEVGTSYDFLMNIDLMKMGLVPGGLITMRLEGDSGSSINSASGNWPTMAPNYNAIMPLTDMPGDDSNTFDLTTLTYTQFLSEKFGVFIGRFDNNHQAYMQEFAGGGQKVGERGFMNMSLALNPIVANLQPYTTALGGGAFYQFTDKSSLTVIVQDARESSSELGLDQLGEAGYNVYVGYYQQYQISDKPGGLFLAGFYNNNATLPVVSGRKGSRLDNGMSIDRTETKREGSAVAFNLWQYVSLFDQNYDGSALNLTDNTPDLKGIGVFVQGGMADPDISLQKWNIALGVGGKGLFDSRPNDTFGIGYYYNAMNDSKVLMGNDYLQVIEDSRDNQHGWELYYDFAVTPWLSITPDIQFNSSDSIGVDDSTILGLRVNITY